ncbi:ribonuclease H-like protein, partial [Exidia glandulosa HHB12029]
DGSCHNNGKANAAAGSGVYWGENASLNTCARTPGPGQTNNRGELFALAIALRDADPRKDLHIVSDSEYAITAATWNAPKAAARDWKVPNGDVVKMTTWLIQRRSAPVEFSWTKGHDKSKYNQEADKLANKGALK